MIKYKHIVIALIVLTVATAWALLEHHTVRLSYNQSHAAGATYYVAVNGGSDSRSCSQATSTSTPKQTLNNAIGCLSAGDTLLVRAGTYAEALIDPVIASGSSWVNKVRIAAYPNETVWMKPPTGPTWVIYFETNKQFIEFDGINLNASNGNLANQMGGLFVFSDGAHHIRFQNAEVIGNRVAAQLQTSRVLIDLGGAQPGTAGIGWNEVINVKVHGSAGDNSFYGIYIHSSNNTVDRCEIYDVGMIGLTIYNSYTDQGVNAPPSTGNVIKNCRIHDIVRSYDDRRMGIQTAGNDTTIYNNVVYNINADGSGSVANTAAISLYGGSNNKVYYNTFANNTGPAIDAYNQNSSVITGNISYGNTQFVRDSGGNVNLSQGANFSSGNPSFVNSGAGNFALNTGSSAINSGPTIAVVATDILGAARPQGSAYDFGAYEYGGVVMPPPPPGPVPPPPPPSSISFSASPTTISTGSSVNLTWSNIPNPSTLDWIGLFHPADTSETDWLNISCVQAPASAPIPSGSCAFPIKANITPGTYEFRLLSNNSYTVLAKSQTITITSGVTPVVGDINLDHIVNSLDWSLMNAKWFTNDTNCDLNHDGIVNAIDFSLLNANWFKTW